MFAKSGGTKLKIKFKADLRIDGMEYVKGKTYTMPDWLARSFVSSGYAAVPGLNVGKKKSTKVAAKK